MVGKGQGSPLSGGGSFVVNNDTPGGLNGSDPTCILAQLRGRERERERGRDFGRVGEGKIEFYLVQRKLRQRTEIKIKIKNTGF